MPGLFELLKQASRKFISNLQGEERRQLLTFTPGQLDDFGRVLFSGLRSGGFCTFVVSGKQGWNPRTYYFEAARQAAARGRDITRAFLIPHRSHRSDTVLREHIAMDRAAGIKVELLLIGDLLAQSSIPLIESLDFGIWDEAIVCTGVRSSTVDFHGLAEWRVSARPEDLQHARELMVLLLKEAPRVDLDKANGEELNLEEPMISTAPVADFLSTVLCRGNHVSKEDCSWYHSIWQYLRVFNMVSTPTWHFDFYFAALKRLADRAATRLLISGTADYSTLAHVLWSLRNATAHVTILDLCETPLFLCKWYAKSVSCQVETIAMDIFKYSPDVPFDCIITDAFLTRFSPNERNAVVRQWASLLNRENGMVITTTRLEQAAADGVVRATPTQADSFRHRAAREAKKWAEFIPMTPSEIGNRAQRYPPVGAVIVPMFPVRSPFGGQINRCRRAVARAPRRSIGETECSHPRSRHGRGGYRVAARLVVSDGRRRNRDAVTVRRRTGCRRAVKCRCRSSGRSGESYAGSAQRVPVIVCDRGLQYAPKRRAGCGALRSAPGRGDASYA